jgi:hypothetical protein
MRNKRRAYALMGLGMTGALVAGLLGLGAVAAAPAHAASSPTTPMWSTQLDFDNSGVAWSESYFAGLRADGLTTAELDMPWGTIEPSAGAFSFTIWDQELANAAAAGIQLIPIFWQAGWGGSPAPWITDFEESSSGATGQAPDWWNSTEQSEYFTYVEDTIQNSLAQPGGYGGAVLDYGYLDAQWDLNGAGGGYTTDDIAEFQNVYLPDTYGTIATFNSHEGTTYTSFSQVPAEAPGQSLFGVFQAFRAWSVQQTYGQLTADVRNITASTPLYYYYGGDFGNVTNYANNPDTFFKLAKQYNVTVIADSANNTGMTLVMASLAHAYGVKMAEEWTAPSSNSELAANAVQWLDSYGMTFPQAGGEDFFIHDGTEKDIVGFPIYTSWLPTLKTLSGSYPQQPVALYIDVSQGYGNTSGGSLSSVETQAASIWDGFQSGLAIVTSQEVANGAVSLPSFKAVLPLNGRHSADRLVPAAAVRDRVCEPVQQRHRSGCAGCLVRGDQGADHPREHHVRHRIQRLDHLQPGRARAGCGHLPCGECERDRGSANCGFRRDLHAGKPCGGHAGRVERGAGRGAIRHAQLHERRPGLRGADRQPAADL